MYRLIKTEGTARRGEFVTVHGTVQTPAFMNVATAGAIKGGVSALDLKDLKCRCSYATPTISIFGQGIRQSEHLADCIASPVGTALF